MVKITDIDNYDNVAKEIRCSVFADTKSEVASASIIGLKSGYTIAQGSSLITSAGDCAFMKSDGNWNWV